MAMIVARILEFASKLATASGLVRKRQVMIEATQALLEPIPAATRRETRRLKGREKIGERVGKVIGRYKMAKHVTWTIDDKGVFTRERDDAAIAAEARLDGLCVIRTSLPASELDGPGTVCAYKRLSSVERAFRSLETVDLKIRPVYHRAEPRVRAHVLMCMLAWYVEWHMRQKLKPMLFDDEDAVGADKGSLSARAKVGMKRTSDGDPVYSLSTLIGGFTAIIRNTLAPECGKDFGLTADLQDLGQAMSPVRAGLAMEPWRTWGTSFQKSGSLPQDMRGRPLARIRR